MENGPKKGSLSPLSAKKDKLGQKKRHKKVTKR